jgi:hypothetical protein
VSITAASEGGSNVSRETFLAFVGEIRDAKAAVDSANGTLRNTYKRAESAGLDKKELKEAIRVDGLSGAAREEAFRLKALYMAWLGKPIGFQSSLDLPQTDDGEGDEDASPESGDPIAEHQVRNAQDNGLAAGRSGQDRGSNPWSPGTFMAQQWDAAWIQGQQQIADTLVRGDA